MPELLISMGLMSMVALAMAALSTALRTTRSYADGQGAAAQHARVAISRIRTTIEGASATPDFPGMAVLSTQVGSFTFPDTLVVWKPTGSPVNAAGPPLYSELVIYCPDPTAPYRLLEITVPTDTRATPPLTDTAAWLSNINTIKTSSIATKTVLTDMLRVADAASSISSNSTSNQLRGAVRFHVTLRPSQADWASYQAGTTAWSDLNWVQSINGSQAGLRQSWCRMELQLVASSTATATAATEAIPFFGSAALYYEIKK